MPARQRPIVVLAGILLLAAASLSMAQPTSDTPQSLTLPGGPLTLYVHQETGELVGMTANARYHLTIASVTDTWQRRPITTIAELAASAAIIPYEEIAGILEDLDPLTVGEGPIPVIAFVSPTCPACRVLFDDLAVLTDRFRFQLLLLAVNDAVGRLVRKLACAVDPDAAVQALFSHDYGALRRGPCDPSGAANRAVAAQIFGVRGTPFLVRHDGAVLQGLPEDLATWLAEARP